MLRGRYNNNTDTDSGNYTKNIFSKGAIILKLFLATEILSPEVLKCFYIRLFNTYR